LNEELSDTGDMIDTEHVVQMLMKIAEHCLMLEEFSISLPNDYLDISEASTRAAMTTMIKRLQLLEIHATYLIDEDDPESYVCSLFNSPGIDLRSLDICTSDENVGQIAMVLRGCENASTLNLVGKANISEVMMKISTRCHLLVDLNLNYNESVGGEAVIALLRSCRQLQLLTIRAVLEVQAYEALALYGGCLINLSLHSEPASTVYCFPADSALYDANFKQQPRKRPLAKLICHAPALDVKSLAKFLSCFGVIDYLSIELYPELLPADFRISMYDEIPVYYARELYVYPVRDIKDQLDMPFLAFMHTCRSLRGLRIMSHYSTGINLDTSTMITCVYNCVAKKNPLQSLAYPRSRNLSQLKAMLPELKLYPQYDRASLFNDST
jgi:hypothetical protein